MPNGSDQAPIIQTESRWRDKNRSQKERSNTFTTLSGIPVDTLYTPAALPSVSLSQESQFPGEYPFLRGIHASGYRGRLWTMRQFSGFGSARETNQRFRYLLANGQTGLSVAFDLPTLMGYDTDDPQAKGEYGKCGVAVSSLRDMETLFQDIPLDQVTTSMTINGPAAVIWAMYILAAEKQGVPMQKLGGTLQNDILKEYTAQNEYIFPPQPSIRLVVDTIQFAEEHMPLWNPISISGYHIREAGSTAVQELAFTLADGFAYADACLERGMEIDQFAPRLSFFFNIHNYFFEEVAKFRAARRIWAGEMRKRYAAKDARSWWMRCHAQTAGCSLTAQQPENNIVRVALQALAAVLGGVQSLHTNAMDEAWALPTDKTALIALRTQQIIAHESGVADTIDPAGGSYFLESLTLQMEEGAREYFRKIDEIGGVISAIEKGFFVREIADAASRYQQEVEKKERIIVGVNEFRTEGSPDIPTLKIDPKGEKEQIRRLKALRKERDNRSVRKRLAELRQAAKGNSNLMPYILEAVRANATLGETCDALREVFGEYAASTVA